MEYHVATTGDDTNNGTTNSPFATIQRADDDTVNPHLRVVLGGEHSYHITVQARG